MNRVYLLALLVAGLAAVTVAVKYAPDTDRATAAQNAGSEQAAPNFVIFIADDLGWNDIGVYGNRAVHTPNIDNIAAGGLRFDNVFLTTSSCSASRASILTGKYPHSNGLVHLHQSLSASESTLGQLLAQGGYHTESVGKWGLGPDVKPQFSSVIEERTDSSTERWVERLKQRPVDKPFFFWLASRDPHRPFSGGADLDLHKYDPGELVIPSDFVDGPGTRQEFAAYYSEVTRFDRDIGLVMEELDAQGVLDNTLVIIMSDNGRPFINDKQTLYDDGIKTPFILHWPRMITRPGERRQLISIVDLAPSLLDWAGLPVPVDMQGHSISATLDDPDITIREYIYAERNWHARNYHERALRSLDYLYKENQHPMHGACVRPLYASKQHYKDFLAAYQQERLEQPEKDCFARNRAPVELMAIDAEGNTRPGNLVAVEEHAAALHSMRTSLERWRRDTGDFNYLPYERPDAKK